jgi:lipoic acid synthetase
MKSVHPPWLKLRLENSLAFQKFLDFITEEDIPTVCQEANCPNRFGCFANLKVTFLILGRNCTRRCGFCAVSKGETAPVDSKEIIKIEKAIRKFNLTSVVITSVTRDDLSDGGAGHFSFAIKYLREKFPYLKIEVLIPDFQGNRRSWHLVAASAVDILGHNIETVPRLYATVRPQANYRRSLNLLKFVRNFRRDLKIKSGFMLGLGEEDFEIIELLNDLKFSGVDIVTIGQYLKPSKYSMEVKEYVALEKFQYFTQQALNIGFSFVFSNPLIRSSNVLI